MVTEDDVRDPDAAYFPRDPEKRAAEHAVYHAVAEEGVPCREIAGVIGRRLNLPVVSVSGDDVDAHFGWFVRWVRGRMIAEAHGGTLALGQWTDGSRRAVALHLPR